MNFGEDRVFKALGDRRRRKVLDLLKTEPLTTGEICNRFPTLDRCTVMQHLGVLERASLISAHASAAVEFLAKMKHNLE